jgi:hypothetical protein
VLNLQLGMAAVAVHLVSLFLALILVYKGTTLQDRRLRG